MLARTRALLGQGKFDEALGVVAQAEPASPIQQHQATLLREDVLAQKERAVTQAQAAEIERLFTQAMDVFEQGRYEEAIALFEQVMAQEAKLGAPGRFAEQVHPR